MRGRLYNGITIVAGVVFRITCLNIDRGQAGAKRENRAANGCHAAGDGDGGQAGAITESRDVDGCHGIRDGDRSQVAAIIESHTADGSHRIANSFIDG